MTTKRSARFLVGDVVQLKGAQHRPRSPHALIRAIERNVRAYIDGGRPREQFDRIAKALWAEVALDPVTFADVTAYFAKVTLAHGATEVEGAEARLATIRFAGDRVEVRTVEGQVLTTDDRGRWAIGDRSIPESCPHSASQNMGGACERCIAETMPEQAR